jgi:hypothetical protein
VFVTGWLGVEAVDEAPSLCQGNLCLRRCTTGSTYFGVEKEYQNAIEDENQLDEGILFLASKGKESGTWRVNFTLILVLKTLTALKSVELIKNRLLQPLLSRLMLSLLAPVGGDLS